jgi:hypothetical protein
MATVCITLYNLYIEIEDEATYPDQVSDLSARALHIFQEALRAAKENNVDICKMELEDLGDED